MGGIGSSGHNRIGHRPMTAAERQQRSRRIRAEKQNEKRLEARNAFDAIVEKIERPGEAPSWWRRQRKEPLEIVLGRKSYFA
jgi:hypothetical protein